MIEGCKILEFTGSIGIKQAENQRRGIVAQRDFKKGELILVE
jgi:hypothetical protein